MLSDEYIAGFFDGEGHFGCRSGIGRTSGGQSFKLCFTQKELRVLELIQKQYGGGIYTGRAAAQLELTGTRAIACLKAILPHLVVKKQMAELFLRMWSVRMNREEVQRLWESRESILRRNVKSVLSTVIPYQDTLLGTVLIDQV